jgi:hypothetical protein
MRQLDIYAANKYRQRDKFKSYAFEFAPAVGVMQNREVSMTIKPSFKHIRQVYKVTYPTGKIYIGKDLYGSYRYFGSPDPEIVNKDFESLTDSERKKYSVTKEILWESASCSEKELAQKEVEFIREFDSNNPAVGYNRWPKHQKNTDHG